MEKQPVGGACVPPRSLCLEVIPLADSSVQPRMVISTSLAPEVDRGRWYVQ